MAAAVHAACGGHPLLLLMLLLQLVPLLVPARGPASMAACRDAAKHGVLCMLAV
jgi:hypothetical protein